ncbi:MAG: ribonuclease P protein component [Candidatus Comchoanobacterales bacterium]
MHDCRLKKSADIRAIRGKPPVLKASTLLIYRKDSAHHRLAIMVAKKSFPKAHDRNRVKRVIRHVFYQLKNVLLSGDYVFQVRNNFRSIDQSQQSREVQKICDRLISSLTI